MWNKILGDIGEQIPQNADMNSYIKPGRYWIGDSSTGKTVKNLPAGVYGSTLFVTYAGYDQPFQILIAHNGNMFVRRASYTDGWEWTKWKTFSEEIEVAVSTMDSFHKIDILDEK